MPICLYHCKNIVIVDDYIEKIMKNDHGNHIILKTYRCEDVDDNYCWNICGQN
jgi:hypothetical protein